MTSKLPTRLIGNTGLAVSELGFGAAPLGNLYRPVSDGEANATLRAALKAGVAYVDTAPYYGFGLSERRVGNVLRDMVEVVVSTKVGRLLRADSRVHDDAERHGFRSSMPFEPVYDYSHDGVMRSWEASLQRLGLARVDILYVHDIGRFTHGDVHEETFRQLTQGGGFRALEELRAGGAIRAFGLGVNETSICLEAMQETRLDVILLAGRYTLLEQGALHSLLPECARVGTSVVIGGPYNSGILASGTRHGGPLHYNYRPAPETVIEHVRRIEVCCDAHGVALAAAALQFPLAHPQIASIIPGLGSTSEIEQTLSHYRARIPSAFWKDLRAGGLVRSDAPVPEVTAP